MRIHIVGICGTFMAGVALIARDLGFDVSGCDQHVYPPMSDVLSQANIKVTTGYDLHQLNNNYDFIIIGNSFSRGHPYIEAIMQSNLRYISGPQWLFENVLQHKHVLAVAGTHGKTTTSSLLAWLLQQAGFNPGYLIGGSALNFELPASIGDSNYFVIEADEYDTAFFDKRSKFVHYHPTTLILNNLEFDHADIFADLSAIKTQFNHLIRTVPGNGLIVSAANDQELDDVIAKGVWTPITYFGIEHGAWQAREIVPDGSQFELWHDDSFVGLVKWQHLGEHNILNALAASAAALNVGMTYEDIYTGLISFAGVKRRMEVFATTDQITFYDDFAHHPTAIATTLSGLRSCVKNEKIMVMLQLGSRSMQRGAHFHQLIKSLDLADYIWVLSSKESCDSCRDLAAAIPDRVVIYNTVNEILTAMQYGMDASHVVLMSNKSFDGLVPKISDMFKGSVLQN